jgi:hypothetical protein
MRRVVLPLIALFFATGAEEPQTVQVQPAPGATPMLGSVIGDQGSGVVCRDRIQEVRRELGQPPLDRTAAPADPLFIAAVDKRIGGCSVLVMRNDTSDIRPLPAPREHRLMPAK